MKTKIYLAKSNRANPDDLSQIRSIIQKYPNDIELVEFKGGAYSHKDLLACDLLVVLPDLTDFDNNFDDVIRIGKGLHQQIEAFQQINKNVEDILLVDTVTQNWNSVAPLYDIDLLDANDYINYAQIVIDTHPDTAISRDLEDIIKERFISNSTGINLSSDNEIMYVLIKH